MGSESKLHPRVKGIVSQKDRGIQIGLRWLNVLATSLVAVQAGHAVDSLVTGMKFPGSWWAWSLLWIVVAAVTSGLATTQSLRVQSRAERELRKLSQDGWFRLGPIESRSRSGRLLDLATSGAVRAGRYRGGFLSSSVASLSAPLIVLLVMGVSTGWKNAGFMSLVIIFGPVLIGAFQGMNKDVGDRFRASQSQLRETFLDGISALESLSYAGAGNSYARLLARTNEKHRQRIMRLLAGNQLLILIMDLVFSLAALVLATVLAVQGSGNGTMSIGEALSLVLLTIILVTPVDLIGQFFYIGIGGRAAQRQFSALLNEADAAEEMSERLAAVPNELNESYSDEAVLFDRVNARWPDGESVLRNASLVIHKGEHVALVGASGSGKSTISAVIQGLIHPDEGRALTNSQSADGAEDGQIAVVEQRSYLFNDSIAYNLRLARPAATDAELWNALEQANLADDVRAMPSGLETLVGDHGSRLSGGQAQRLAIARALLKDSAILILDEPTSQVDLRGEATILEAVDRAAQGRTVLTIAHRRAAIRSADRVLVMRKGSVLSMDEEVDDEH